MTVTIAEPAKLPTIEEIELADYKLGSLLSDLDMITCPRGTAQGSRRVRRR